MNMTAFSWDCVLPERTQAPLGARKPRGTLSINTQMGEEGFPLPVVVCRAIIKKRDSGELCPSSRSELLYEVGIIEQRCASNRVAKLVDRRDYSCKEATDKLLADGFSPKRATAAVDRAVECGMIDDMRFAGAFIRSKLSCGWGQRRISLELSRRGVDIDEVPGWPEEFVSPEDESRRAYELVSRRRIPERDPYGKLVRFLLGRGFSYGVASDAVSSLLCEMRDV